VWRCALTEIKFAFKFLREGSGVAMTARRHPKANSLIRNFPNKIEHVLTKTEIKDAKALRLSVKSGGGGGGGSAFGFCVGVHLVKEYVIM
jgi:hypothetical protein